MLARKHQLINSAEAGPYKNSDFCWYSPAAIICIFHFTNHCKQVCSLLHLCILHRFTCNWFVKTLAISFHALVEKYADFCWRSSCVGNQWACKVKGVQLYTPLNCTTAKGSTMHNWSTHYWYIISFPTGLTLVCYMSIIVCGSPVQ